MQQSTLYAIPYQDLKEFLQEAHTNMFHLTILKVILVGGVFFRHIKKPVDLFHNTMGPQHVDYGACNKSPHQH